MEQPDQDPASDWERPSGNQLGYCNTGISNDLSVTFIQRPSETLLGLDKLGLCPVAKREKTHKGELSEWGVGKY